MIRRCKLRVGSRAQVMHGIAKMTAGGLTKIKLKYNKQGKIVSKKASNTAKKANKLVKAGYITKKGHFGVIKRGGVMGATVEGKVENAVEYNKENFEQILQNNKFIRYGYPSGYVDENDKLLGGDEIFNSAQYRNFMYNIQAYIISNEPNLLLTMNLHIVDKRLHKQDIHYLIGKQHPAPVGNFVCYLKCLEKFITICENNTILTKIINLFIGHFYPDYNNNNNNNNNNKFNILVDLIEDIISGDIILRDKNDGNFILRNFENVNVNGFEYIDIPRVLKIKYNDTPIIAASTSPHSASVEIESSSDDEDSGLELL